VINTGTKLLEGMYAIAPGSSQKPGYCREVSGNRCCDTFVRDFFESRKNKVDQSNPGRVDCCLFPRIGMGDGSKRSIIRTPWNQRLKRKQHLHRANSCPLSAEKTIGLLVRAIGGLTYQF